MDRYVLAVTSGKENQTATLIARRGQMEGRLHALGEISYPMTSGRRKGERSQRLWPGYLIVECEWSVDLQHWLYTLPHVRNFMGAVSRLETPTPLTQAEFDHMVAQTQRPAEPSYVVGDAIRVIDGSFTGWEGTIVELHPHAVVAKFLIFGRETNTELPPEHIRKIRKEES
jgi:transcriptional antiterminator NusG